MTTGRDLPPAETILRFGEHLRHDLEGVDRDPGAIGASLIATSALRWLRAALAAGDPDVAGPVAEALGLSEQVRGCDHGFIHPDPDLPQVWSSNVPCPTADQRRFVTDWTDAP